MKFREGDKVKFLNENLQGVVVSVDNGQRIYVRIEDGFEIPASENQLVLVDGVQGKASEKPREDRIDEDLYICFYPQANQSLRVYFANHSGSKIAIVVSAASDGNYRLLHIGSVENSAQVNLDSLSVLQSANWPVYHVQALFPPDDEVKNPFYRSFAPDSSIFERNLKSFGGRDAYVFGLREIGKTYKAASVDPITEDDLNQLKQKDFGTDESDEAEAPLTLFKANEEVDLHIEKIDPDWRKLASSNILTLQLMHASRALDSAYSAGKGRIVLIHGGGSGKLRSELLKMLSKHEAVRSTKPADPLQYGGGAIEVTLN